jgi:hypothetical protein
MWQLLSRRGPLMVPLGKGGTTTVIGYTEGSSELAEAGEQYRLQSALWYLNKD